jgi:LAO/AO transport system kinase
LVPESGDGVQAMKAGLMEIGDIFVLNKSDRPGADRAVDELRSALELKRKENAWNPPVIATVANKDQGLTDLMDTLKAHWRILAETGALKEKRLNRRRERVRKVVERELRRRLWTEDRAVMLERALHGEDNPFKVATKLLDDFLKK